MSKVSLQWRPLVVLLVLFMVMVGSISYFTGLLPGIEAIKLIAWAGTGFAIGWIMRTGWLEGGS